MANQSVSWKGCDIPITHGQACCDISITTRFAIFDAAKYHFWCSQVAQKAREVRILIRAWTPLCHNWYGLYHFWWYQVPQAAWSLNRERACGSCMWQKVAMPEPSFSLDWIWNLLKNVCKSALSSLVLLQNRPGSNNAFDNVSKLIGDRVPMNGWPRRGLQRTNQGVGVGDIFLSFFLFELRRGESMGQPEGRLTAEILRSSGRVVRSRQLPWEERVGMPVPKCQLEWRSIPLSDEMSAPSRMPNFVWQMTRPCIGALILVWNTWTEQKEPKSTRPWFQLKFRFTQVVALWPRICACQKFNQSARTRIRHGESHPPRCARRAVIHRSHPSTRVWFHTSVLLSLSRAEREGSLIWKDLDKSEFTTILFLF